MNRLSRRAFLGGAVSVAAVVVLPVAIAERAAATGVTAGRTAALKRSIFLPLLNSSFHMADGRGSPVPVVLSQIGDLKPATTPNDEDRFSLIFSGPKSQPRSQGTYHFRNPQLGTVDLFVVPVDRVTSVRHYQAVINLKP